MLHFKPMPTVIARAYQNGEPDAYGRVPERQISDGEGAPCRHCLKHVPKGAEMLVLAYCPFPEKQPYAETGPIFLCADQCEAHSETEEVPEVLTTSPTYLLKGYTEDDRILYGSGAIIKQGEVTDAASGLLKLEGVKYVHVRSASNNCYITRIE